VGHAAVKVEWVALLLVEMVVLLWLSPGLVEIPTVVSHLQEEFFSNNPLDGSGREVDNSLELCGLASNNPPELLVGGGKVGNNSPEWLGGMVVMASASSSSSKGGSASISSALGEAASVAGAGEATHATTDGKGPCG